MASSDDCYSSGSADNLEYDSDNGQSATYPQPYVVLDQYEISRQQDEEIMSISTSLSLPTSSSTLLLYHYKWNVDALLEAWFADEALVRATVGLVQKTTDAPGEEPECGICLNIYPRDTTSAAACGHRYCAACWSSYIGASINKGPGCLNLRCPHPSCSAAVDQFMVYKLASSDNRSKYSCYLLQSYVEMRKPLTRFCPSSDCELVVEFGNAVHYDVECRCSHQFCLVCMEDAHRPLNCSIVAKWVEEGEKNWLPHNSKRCPKCMDILSPPILPLALPLECSSSMPMEWDNFGMPPSLSMEWDNFGLRKEWDNSGYNRDKPASITEAARQEGEARRRGSVVRFRHHKQQWSYHKRMMIDARMRLKELQGRGGLAGKLHGKTELILKALMQIVDCRRILKLSYVYGYFLEEPRSVGFEVLQSQAELELIKLAMSVEELETSYRSMEDDEVAVKELKIRLMKDNHLTSARFEKLTAELERELQLDTMKEIDETDTNWKLCACLQDRSPFILMSIVTLR